MNAFEVQEIIKAMKHCTSAFYGKCKGCPYLHRTAFGSCEENLMADAKKVMIDQQKLIAKFGKMLMK
jgi:Fe-S cluster biogenesis protein NfuA